MSDFRPTFIVSFEIVVPLEDFDIDDDDMTMRDMIAFAVNNALDWINGEETANISWIDEDENHHAVSVEVKYGTPFVPEEWEE